MVKSLGKEAYDAARKQTEKKLEPIKNAFIELAMETEIKLLPCPFCGEEPEVSVEGTCLDIECCNCGVAMSMYKTDFISFDERKTWSDKTYSFSDIAEQKALNGIVNQWNNRSKNTIEYITIKIER